MRTLIPRGLVPTTALMPDPVARSRSRLLLSSLVSCALGCAVAACGSHDTPPTSVTAPPPERELTPTPRVATAVFRTCLIRGDDAHVLCWGLLFGPPPVIGHPPDIGSWIVDGLEHALEVDVITGGVCARVEGGAVRCALAPENGTLADAISVQALEGATSIAMLTDSECAWICGAMPDGTLRCVTHASTEPRVVTPVHADDVLRARRVGSHVCLLRRDNDVTCFSANDESVVSFTGTRDAIAVGGGPCFVSAAGAVRCCAAMSADAPCHDEPSLGPAIAVAGGVWGGWTLSVGRDGRARAIHGPGGEVEESPVAHFDAHDLVGLVSDEGACLVGRAGAISCLGPNNYGQLDTRVASPPDTPTQVIGAHDVIDLVADNVEAFALGADGTVFTWSARTDRATPQHVEPALVELAGAGYGRDAEGRVYELGAAASFARRIEGLDARGGLVGGLYDRLCAVDGEGAVSCLGRPVEIGITPGTPHRMPTLDGLTSLAVVRATACGLRDGRVRCADIDDPDAPATEVVGVNGITRVLGGDHQWLFVRGDGSVLVRDDEPASDTAAMVRRGPWSAVIGAAFAEGRTCAWRASGPLACDITLFGVHRIGQPTEADLVTIPSVTDVRAVALADASCAALADGTVWCWGHGARADGHRIEAREPVPVPIEAMRPN